MTVLTLNLQQFIETADEFWQLCQANPELRLERTAMGEVVIMPPAFSETGRYNSAISGQLWQWNDVRQLGIVFDSSAGFTLPNGAIRSPDTSWIAKARWENLPTEAKYGFSAICPDFVIELRSTSDSLKDVRAKMKEYIENGAQLGWLIDPQSRTVEIYEPGEEVEILHDPIYVTAEPLLPQFVLNLQKVWD